MKILHVADFGRSGNLNGVGEAVLHLSESQNRLGEDVIVAYTRHNPYIKNLNCVMVKDQREFECLVNHFCPNITIFHSFYDFKHPLFANILIKMNIPYLITFHGGASKENYRKKRILKFIANNVLFKPYINKSTATIYLNEGERQQSIFTLIDGHKSFLLPNGINIPERKHEYNSTKGIVISFLSRLDYYGKGLDVLLPAIKSIEEDLRKLNVRFRFFGYHYNDGTVEKINSTSALCEYCGYVLGDDKERALLDSDIMILPSRSEGMPVSILEALSYGIPCLVTPETNVADIINKYDCGWIADLSPDGLSTTILKGITDYQNNSFRLSNNAITASLGFSWDSISHTSIDLYNQLLGKINNEVRYSDIK